MSWAEIHHQAEYTSAKQVPPPTVETAEQLGVQFKNVFGECPPDSMKDDVKQLKMLLEDPAIAHAYIELWHCQRHLIDTCPEPPK